MARSGNADIADVFQEYLQKEQEFAQEIEERNRLRREIRDKHTARVSALQPATGLPVDSEKSRVRNRILLKADPGAYRIYLRQDLEMCRARLRTYASYTPTDEELQQISSAYRSHLYRRLPGTGS